MLMWATAIGRAHIPIVFPDRQDRQLCAPAPRGVLPIIKGSQGVLFNISLVRLVG